MDTSQISHRSVDLGQTQVSTSSAQPSAKSQPSAETKKIVAEIGLRYRPAAAADLEAHAYLIGLLVVDLADVNPGLLDQAGRQWAKTKHFMPKASELIALAQHIEKQQIADRRTEQVGEGTYDRFNRDFEAAGSNKRWINGSLTTIDSEPQKRNNGSPKEDPRTPLSDEEISKLQHGDDLGRSVFDMGVSQGWIVVGSDGIYRDSANVWGGG